MLYAVAADFTTALALIQTCLKLSFYILISTQVGCFSCLSMSCPAFSGEPLSRSKVKVARSRDASDRCWPISRERKVLETPKLVRRLPTRRAVMHTSSESRQRPLQVFAPILWSALTLDTIVPTGANPLRGSVIIFAPARCCYMTSYLTLCLLIRCDHITIVLLPEYCRNCEKGIHYGRLVGCKLYKICFCSPNRQYSVGS